LGKLKEKVSYLNGLIEGMAIGDTKEAKLFSQIAAVLEEISDAVEELDATQAELEDYIECIDEDLGILESDYYGFDEEEMDDDDLDFVEVECPYCHEKVYLEEDVAYGDAPVFCPNCNEQIHFVDEDYEEDDDEETEN
jgi:formylmethanofuran dehydrogenase subunit E